MPITGKKRSRQEAFGKRKQVKGNSLFGSPQRYLKVGFPKQTTVKLRYITRLNLSPASAGLTAHHSFRANGPFDPDQTGIGHQPQGYDQWSAFYNHYVVLKARIKATFSIGNTDTTGGMVCGIQTRDVSTFDDAEFERNLENATTSHKVGAYTAGANLPVMVSKTFEAKRFFNVTDVKDNISRLGAVVLSAPTEEAFFTIFVGSSSAGVNPGTVYALVQLEYDVLFSEPKLLPLS